MLMKDSMHKLTISAALLAFAPCFVTVCHGQVAIAPPPPPPTIDLTQGVYIASSDVDHRSLRHYAGHKLFNTEGAELGSVRDFLVHPATNRIHYAVVSTGGVLGGMGNSLRLVPMESLRRGTHGNHFEVDILQAHWLQLPPINDQDYVVDRFDISPTRHQELVQRFGPGDRVARSGVALSTPGTTAYPGLIRASVIRGKTVRTADRKVGDVENIILDLDRGTVGALLDTVADFTGTSAKYVVPLSYLAFNDSRQNPVSTTLSRADFDAARPAIFPVQTFAVATPPPPQVVVTTPPPVVSQPSGAPTGPTSDSTSLNQSSDPAVSAARAVRRAIDNDPALIAENVHVSVENGRVVLRGTVRNEGVRTNVENAVKRVMTPGSFDSYIAVVNR
jgi:sporulation protein YlmC with PRC-barrel domain